MQNECSLPVLEELYYIPKSWTLFFEMCPPKVCIALNFKLPFFKAEQTDVKGRGSWWVGTGRDQWQKKVFLVSGSLSGSSSVCQKPAINLSAADRLKETLLKVSP